MRLQFGSFQYRDIAENIVPLSPKPLQMLAAEALECSLESALLATQSSEHIKNWRSKIALSQASTFRANHIYSLQDALTKPIMSLGHQRVELHFKGPSIPPEEIALAPPSSCESIEVLAEKKLRTQTNITYLFVGLSVNLGSIVPAGHDYHNCNCPWDSLWANGHWGRNPILYFVCRICGRFYVCECFRNSIEMFHSQSLIDDPHKVQPPHLSFLAAYDKIVYRDHICHLCTRTPADFDAVFRTKYRTSFNANYLPYITREVVSDPEYWETVRLNRTTSPDYTKRLFDVHRAAENRVREAVGKNLIGLGWATEAQVYYMVQSLFPDEPVVHQGSPSWLGWMRFDVYLPLRKVAIEYQGIQHFKPIDYFGGEEGLAKTKERDKKKLELALKNGVHIIYLDYSDPISRDQLKSMILKASVITA
jgi:hypothetical protein